MRYLPSILLAVALPLTGTVLAAAPPRVGNEAVVGAFGSTSHNLEKRRLGSVYLCTAENFTGDCVLITGGKNGECMDLASDLNDRVVSFGPDGGQYCFVYQDWGCSGSTHDYTSYVRPGVANMDGILKGQISSYKCLWGTGGGGE
ncbi:hypothetical protein C8J56DRAFT_923614 [Mycena floridula]|nr:hypothetical protein C8J56DRAFT_923614 [Mycena floridula]